MEQINRNIIQIYCALLSIIFSFHIQFSIANSKAEKPLGIFRTIAEALNPLEIFLENAGAGNPSAIASTSASVENPPPYHPNGPYPHGPYPHGPPNKGTCHLKPLLVDPRVITATRESIQLCIEKVYNCSSAQKSKFRTIDGSCNNIKHPTWGKSDNCLQRVLPYDYADGKSMPRVSHSGNPLPPSRLVSNVFHREIGNHPSPDSTTMKMEWGQLIAHDLSLNDIFRLPDLRPIDCCSNGPVTNGMCISSAIPPDDPVYNNTCQGSVRTIPCSVCKSVQRIGKNENTAFQDLSLVYGSTEERAKELRSGHTGMLRVEYNRKSGPMPPTVLQEGGCISPHCKPVCYHAGDSRVNMTPFLLTLHVIFLRLHNYICYKLSKINPHWDDERIYQEARRINIALVQFLTYRKYLPLILGEDIMKQEGIQVLPDASYTNYDPKIDPTIADEFTAVAARYGHTMIPGNLSTVDLKTGETKTEQLRNLYFNPFGFSNGNFDKVAKGMTLEKHEEHDRLLTEDVRSFLFHQNRTGAAPGADLASISIDRGRDHGIPGYSYYVYFFFGIIIKDFDDLKAVMAPKSVELLKSLYECVHDVDFYTAGLAANHVKDGLVSASFAKVLVAQYKHLKFGDRYWFEHKNQAGSFTPEQLKEIKKSTLANILCKTTKIKKIQNNPFFPPSSRNPIIPCDETHDFDFSLWYEENECQVETVKEQNDDYV